MTWLSGFQTKRLTQIPPWAGSLLASRLLKMRLFVRSSPFFSWQRRSVNLSPYSSGGAGQLPVVAAVDVLRRADTQSLEALRDFTEKQLQW